MDLGTPWKPSFGNSPGFGNSATRWLWELRWLWEFMWELKGFPGSAALAGVAWAGLGWAGLADHAESLKLRHAPIVTLHPELRHAPSYGNHRVMACTELQHAPSYSMHRVTACTDLHWSVLGVNISVETKTQKQHLPMKTATFSTYLSLTCCENASSLM